MVLDIHFLSFLSNLASLLQTISLLAQTATFLLTLAFGSLWLGFRPGAMRHKANDSTHEPAQADRAELELINNQLENAIARANEMAAQAAWAEEQVCKREDSLNEAQRLAHIGSWRQLVATGETSWSREMFHIFGKEQSSGVLPWSEMRENIHPEDWLSFETTMKDALTNGKHYTVEVRAKHPDGTPRWLLLTGGNASREYAGEVEWVSGTIQDITERKCLQEELQKQATTDELTGVTNRRHFLELAHIELRRAIRLNQPLAVALIDLDHFKAINDTYGHMAGDQALRFFTKICLQNIREIDVFARIGGDEFTLLLPETRCEHAHQVVLRIRRALADTRLDFSGIPVSISLSAGIASLSNNPESFEILLSRADQALY
jgi:diguanylate cyclase (GGDEF)-like protein/PAS domain S-box-containing protein